MSSNKAQNSAKQNLKAETNPKIFTALEMVLFFFSIFIGYKIFAWLTQHIIGFPYGFGSESVDVLVIITGLSAVIMLTYVSSKIFRSKRGIIFIFSFLVAYSAVFGLIQTPQVDGNVGFNFYYSFILMLGSLFAGLLLFGKRSRNYLFSNFKGAYEIMYVCFVTSIMWLSPLISEIVFPHSLVLGGNGFSDILFSAGFCVLVSSLLYCSFRVILHRAVIGKLIKK